jgi:hypothetical protein
MHNAPTRVHNTGQTTSFPCLLVSHDGITVFQLYNLGQTTIPTLTYLAYNHLHNTVDWPAFNWLTTTILRAALKNMSAWTTAVTNLTGYTACLIMEEPLGPIRIFLGFPRSLPPPTPNVMFTPLPSMAKSPMIWIASSSVVLTSKTRSLSTVCCKAPLAKW